MKCIRPVTLKDPARIKTSRALVVPCGTCGACRANRRSEWSFRLREEQRTAKNTFFVTFTYSEDNLPLGFDDIPTLHKADFQRFMKRLRKHQSKHATEKIRYYAVGEYGSKTQRPHYHAILFNIDVRTLVELNTIWGLGQTSISRINDARIHYTTKYHVNVNKESRKNKQEPEFALMSRRPGIGAGYIERAGKWNHENAYTYVVNNGFKQGIPRYYKNKIFSESERMAMAEDNFTREDIQYWQEYQRLEDLKIANPHAYMKESREHEAKQIINKSQENDKL